MLEESSLDAARLSLEHAYQKENGRDVSVSQRLGNDQLQAWMHQWLVDLTARIKVDIAELAANQKLKSPAEIASAFVEKPNAAYVPTAALKSNILLMYLQVLEPSKLALIAIIEMMRSVGSSGISDGTTAVKAMVNIGKSVEMEHHAQVIRDVSGPDGDLWHKVLEPNSQKPSARLIRSTWQKIGKNVEEGGGGAHDEAWADVWTPAWSHQAQVDIGGQLLASLIKTAKVKRTATHPKTGKEV